MSFADSFEVSTWPGLCRAKQHFQTKEIKEIEPYIADQFGKISSTYELAGKRIGVAVGSRGISRLDEVTRVIVNLLKEAGAKPCIIPAMGSHGGATGRGQTEVLRHLGISEETIGAPVISNMDVTKIAFTSKGAPVYYSVDALRTDGVIVINRVKMHTSFRGAYESGIIKMMVVGLGKHQGALTFHGLGFEDMANNLVEMGRIVSEKANVIGAVGIVENAHEQPAEIAVLKADEILREEPKLLKLSKALMPRIPYGELDVLILQRLGKDISGDGMDPNITGRYTPDTMHPDYRYVPRVTRIVGLGLTEASQGSAVGMGHLDVIPQTFRDGIDFETTYMNSVSATVTNTCKMPIVVPTEKHALQVALWTARVTEAKSARICILQDTLHLEEMIVSEALIHKELPDCPVEYSREIWEMKFGNNGELLLA